MAPRRRCPLCGSKQWHKEPSSGLVVCSEGHVLQNYRNETTETNELGPHAMRKRTLKSGRKKKEKTSKADPKLYHGARARYHYFQCLQLLLRHQIAALTKLWDLPPEFEVVCRDTWALHLSLLPSPPPAEPYYHGREGAGASSPKAENGEGAEAPKSPTSKSGSEDSSSSSSGDDDEEEDPEMAQLLRENSESGSDDDGAAAAPPGPVPAEGRSRKKGRSSKYQSPASNLAVLMFACWTMRIPVMYIDFIRIIESYDLPYLDAVRLLPPTLTTHLTKHTTQSLSPHHAPSTLVFHALTSRLAKLIHSSFGIFTPELNAAPILWRTISCLGATLYNLTKRLAHILSLPLTLHNSLAPILETIKKNDPESHKYDNIPPEVALAATAVIVLKMVYGFDNKPRQPRDPNDPACTLPRLAEYLALVKKLDEADADTKAALFSAKTPLSVGDLTETKLDQYLDFCERALLGPEINEGQRTGLSDYFPLRIGAYHDDGGRAGVTHDLLPAISPSEDAESLLPGQSYPIYNSRDVFGTLPEEYTQVVRRAARCVGVGMDYFCGVMERFEHRFARWWMREKRRSREEKTRKNMDKRG